MKKAILIVCMLVSVHAMAAISEQDKVRFNSMYGGVITPEISAKILNYCDKNDTNIDSCLGKIKTQPSKQKTVANAMGYSQCCWNNAGQWGEYVYARGQSWCIYPCGG